MSPLRPAVISSTIWVVLVSSVLTSAATRPEVERGDPVGDLHHVVHVVRDQYDAAPLVGQAAYEVEDLAGLGHTEGRGGLVEEDHLAVPQHRLGDRHGLALTTRQVGHRLAHRRHRAHRQARQRLACLPLHLAVVEERPHPTDLTAEEHVLGDVEVVGQGEVLVDELDPESGGRTRIGDRHRVPLEGDLPAVEAVDAGDALHQGRLPGAVVTDQRRDLPGMHLEVDVVEDVDGSEALVQLADRQDRFAHRSQHLSSVTGSAAVTAGREVCARP